MDKLYYAVRKMDKTLESVKTMLDEIENNINVERGATVQTRMMKYYLNTAGSEINAACEELDRNTEEEDSDETSDFDENELPDDLGESDVEDVIQNSLNHDDDTVDITEAEAETEGSRIIKSWNSRSKKLRHELAIAAWMCSPVEQIMMDARDNHNGAERDATTTIFKKWFCQQVCFNRLYCFYFFLINCLTFCFLKFIKHRWMRRLLLI